MKGYKVFEPDWTCRGFQYEVGKTFEEDIEPLCCERGFHFCQNLMACFNYYPFDPKNKVAEVEAVGKIDTKIETNLQTEKSCTNKIKIIRELSWEEVLRIVNTGCGNAGFGNNGNRNTGNFNSGDSNTGFHNCGSQNTGDHNNGYFNVGNYNRGNNNLGDYNIGSHNDGYHNIGNHNSGDNNNGIGNRGFFNTGCCNNGDYNIGDCNNGDWNKTYFSNGCFNTKETKIMMFNKPSNWTFREWNNSEAKKLLNNIFYKSNLYDMSQWIDSTLMDDEEKRQYPEYKTTGGYLEKIINIRNNNQDWWDGLSEKNKNIIKDIPNFDAEIFKEITGIDVKS